MKNQIKTFVQTLANKKYNKILFLTCSSRSAFHSKPDNEGRSTGEVAKSTYFAYRVKQALENFDSQKQVTLLEIPNLKIYPCEGNVSSIQSKGCGVKQASLKDQFKNPSGYHRCWASINNPDDELWKVTKPLFESDIVVFYSSIRWGQTCSEHQKLIERLTWIENRSTQLGESSIKLPEAGIVVVGQNYNGPEVFNNQKKVLNFFGFPINNSLCIQWQASQDENDESYESYIEGIDQWEQQFGCNLFSSNQGVLKS